MACLSARASRVARGACRKWQQRYGLRNWSRESEILRRKLARLHRCTMDFAVVSSLLKMGIGFRAIKSEWVTVKRALKAKTKYEQTIIADAQIRRHHIGTAGAVGVRPSTIVCIRCAYSVLAYASSSNAAQRRSSIVYISGRDRLR